MKERLLTNGRLLSQILPSYKNTFEALCELINNSIQAKSKDIFLELKMSPNEEVSPYAFEIIRIKDNGEGVSASQIKNKLLLIATDAKVGGKGIGRFSAFQIGNSVNIETVAYDEQEEKAFKTSINLDAKTLEKSDLDKYEIDVQSEETTALPYYQVTIADFWDDVEVKNNPKKKIIKTLLPENIEEALFIKYSSEILTSKVIFHVNNKLLTSDNFIIDEPEKKSFPFPLSDGTINNIDLEFIHYKGKNKNIILSYRIENNGVKIQALEELLKMEFPETNSWLVQIDSPIFNARNDMFRNLSMDALDDDIVSLKQTIHDAVHDYFKKRNEKFFAFKDHLIQDDFYPYKPGNVANPANSRVIAFNQLAYFLEEDYKILYNNDKLRKIIYPLIDKAISNGDVKDVLESIISLDDDKIKTFKQLLENAELAEVIRFSNDVSKRKQFLDFLNKLVYTEIAGYIPERKLLHKIIEKNLWIFGPEYTNCPILFSDTSIRNNLEQLRNKNLQYEKSEKDENYEEVDDKIKDITDLFFFNERIMNNDKREIMIVELKAPIVKISQKELDQVRRYMYDIEIMDKFSDKFQYKIILVSSGFTGIGASSIGTISDDPTLLAKSKAKDISIHVHKWSDIIANNQKRLSYLGNYLQTKDVDIKTIFDRDYKQLDISKLPIYPGQEAP